MKNMLFVAAPKKSYSRKIFTVARRNFMAMILQLHTRRYLVKSAHYCSCGYQLYFVTSKGRTKCDGYVCGKCALEDIPGL